MFGRKPKFNQTIVAVAFQLGYLTIDVAVKAEEYLKNLSNNASGLDCMVERGYLTAKQAVRVGSEMEAHHPESYLMELTRSKRASIKKTTMGLHALSLRYPENA